MIKLSMSVFALFLLISIKAPLRAAPLERPVNLISDALDDDARGITDANIIDRDRRRLSLIVTSTGNAQLRAGVVKGNNFAIGADVPVYAGTSTDLIANPVTRFAGRNDREGVHVLHPRDLAHLRSLNGVPGDGAAKMVEYWRSLPRGKKVNIGLIAAPTDLVQAIKMDKNLARRKLGYLVAMGLWKILGDGSIVGPFNFQADPQATVELLELYHEGIFEGFIHVPSDTIQQRLGLEGGYIPQDERGLINRSRLHQVMKWHRGLRRIFNGAQEQALAWIDAAVKEKGMVGTEHDRTLPSTFIKSPEEAAGFYLADIVATTLLMMPQDKMLEQHFKRSSITASVTEEGEVSFNDALSAKKAGYRPILELVEMDGWKLLEDHAARLESIAGYEPSAAFLAPMKGEPSVDHAQNTGADISNRKTLDGNANALIVTFKHSPDDWFGVLGLAINPNGSENLRHGGLIAEGFQTQMVAEVIRNALADIGVTDVPVAAGYEYTEEDIKKLPPNFDLERAFNELGQSLRAFEEFVTENKEALTELVKKAREQAPSPGQSNPIPSQEAVELIEKIFMEAKKSSRKVDLMTNAEGIDIGEVLLEGDQSNWDLIASERIMGGGRLSDPKNTNPIQKMILARSWATVRKERIFQRLRKLGSLGKKVFVYSSNEFGGSLTAIDADGNLIGNGGVVLEKLNQGSEVSRVVRAIREHWRNWNRVLRWHFARLKGITEPFDPQATVPVMSTSPLAVEMADHYLRGELERGEESDVQITEIRLDDKVEGRPFEVKPGEAPTGIYWLSRKPDKQSLEPLMQRVAYGFDAAAIATASLANRHHEAVRNFGPFAPESLTALEALTSTAEQCGIAINSPDPKSAKIR